MEYSDLLVEAFVTLPQGGFMFGWSKNIAGERAELVHLDAYGEVVSRHSLGSRGTTRITQILTLANDRLAVVGVVGPDRIAGYGAGDFDVLVTLLND